MKKLSLKTALGFIAAAAVLSSCSSSKTHEIVSPKITFDNGTGIYEVKVNKTITIEPEVSFAENPEYSWKLGGQEVSTEASYEFSGTAAGDYFLTFRVKAANGAAQEEIKVEVLPLTPPVVSLPEVDGVIPAITGQMLVIQPGIVHGDYATYEWTLDGEPVSTLKNYEFLKDEDGDYEISLTVTNEDGPTRVDGIVRAGPMPGIRIMFENDIMTVPIGRKIVLTPYISYATDGAAYSWTVDGTPQAGTDAVLAFTPDTQKDYTVQLEASDGENSDTKTVTVRGVAPEGTYKRAKGPESSKFSTSVFEFLPAPGQFVNEGYTAATMEEACEYAEQKLATEGLISLGGFGGYIVAGFDHSVEKRGAGLADFAIRGNAFVSSSEAGIIWVMQDENGDGIPNDTWYELKGSEFGDASTKQQYSVTYYRPEAANQSIRWIDNSGNAGTIDRAIGHGQNYYPLWVTADSYTLHGTCLGQNSTFDPSTGWYHNVAFDWGYADNAGSDYTGGFTHAKIENAVHPDGTPANLQYIDFVKVQTGLNAKAGWLGEVSTEVAGFKDLNMD